MKSAIGGECAFLTVRNLAMTDSVSGTAVRDAAVQLEGAWREAAWDTGLVSWGRLLNLFKPLLLPLRRGTISSCPPIGVED